MKTSALTLGVRICINKWIIKLHKGLTDVTAYSPSQDAYSFTQSANSPPFAAHTGLLLPKLVNTAGTSLVVFSCITPQQLPVRIRPDATPCRWLRSYRRFERSYCLQRREKLLPQRHGFTSQKTRIFSSVAARASHLAKMEYKLYDLHKNSFRRNFAYFVFIS